MSWPLLLLTFVCGAAYELICVFWVHYVAVYVVGFMVGTFLAVKIKVRWLSRARSSPAPRGRA